MRSRLTYALRQVVNQRRTMVRSFWLLQVPALGLLACSAGDPAAPPPPPAALAPDVEDPPQLGVVNCDSPQTGCPCTEADAVIDCGTVSERRGDYVICSMGTRTCNAGKWGECEGSEVLAQSATVTTNNLRLQSLSAGEDCKNLCDPECVSVVDSPDGLIVDDDLVADPGGLTLPGGSWSGSCSDLSVSPANATINITAIAPNGAITTSPADLKLSATCVGGASVQPSWQIDSYDRAAIDGQGSLSVFSGVGSPIVVTAKSSADTATALVSVRVNIEDRGSNATHASALDGVGVAESGKTLYPYKNTVFPLDLKAPLVQWETGGNNANSVKVALRYQVTGEPTPRFWWSKIYNLEPKEGTLVNTAPAWQIPQEVWSAFDRSAAGAATGAEIIIQRYYASAAHTAMRIPVRFATAALNGTVYYTQYLRTLTTTACSTAGMSPISATGYTVGNICPVGMCTMSSGAGAATTRAIDLSTPTAPNKDPFNGTAGCPVCHSVSTNGTRYVSVNEASSSIGSGVSSIGLDASGNAVFTAVAKAPNYSVPTNLADGNGEASYGFSFGALLPDGSQILQGSTYWGNTLDTPAANNTQDAAMKGVTGNMKPYFLANTSRPGFGVQFATTAALPGNTRSSNVLTGTVAAALNIDGVNVATGNSVLVKNETNAAHNGIYNVTAAGSGSTQWKLTRRSDADANGELTGGVEVRVTDGNANRTKIFYISNPLSASVTINSTSVTFSEKVRPAIMYTAAPLVAKYATTAALAPGTVVHNAATNTLTAGAMGVLTVDGQAVSTSGDVVLVKDEATASRNGLYTLTTVGTALAKWVLTRHTSFDTSPSATSDARPGMEVRVTHGNTHAGKVFAISSPVTGAITVNTTAISFKQTELPAMMVPVFSPDGSKVVYVNGDGDPHPVPLTGTAYDTGWRRGLSMFSYNQSTNTVSNKKRLLNTWSSGTPGTPIKWPFFEPDNSSVLYVQTHPNEYCPSNADDGRCTTTNETYASTVCNADTSVNVNTNIERACYQGARGSMAPTTRGFWPGRLFSLNSGAATVSSTVAELAKLNNGDDDGGADDATDAGKSYQPTVLPFSVGGYRWVIFTSPRPYGHQFNMKNTHFSCGASMLWVAAIDDVASNGTDRSHPAFFLPGQNVGRITSANHYVNERGYLVPSLCKPEGASCGTNDDCCGGSGSDPDAACRAPAGWKPADGPPAKTCAAIPDTCSNPGGSCGSPADCCNGAACVDFVCEAPPTFKAADFTRDYEADCPDSYQPEWQVLSFYLTTEGNSSLEFNIQTANTAAGLATATTRFLGESSNDIVSPDKPDFFSVGKLLDDAMQNGLNHLRMTITFNPSSNGLFAPVLHDWEMKYTCVPAQ